MELKKLHNDVIMKTRSSLTLNTVSQCVLELVLNSLDAKATAIAVRINLVTLRIQVVDNGKGIHKKNIGLVGIRYFTNKCNSLKNLERHIRFYGFRGETLANLAVLSKSVNITSRHSSTSTETYSNVLGKDIKSGVNVARERPSVGTTVTVEGLFQNFPVRKKRIVNELELDDIKKHIKGLVIVHPEVTFSLRDDVSGELIFGSSKNRDIPSAFNSLHPEIKDGTVLKISKGNLSVIALFFKNYSDSNKIQYIYVNKRPIYSSKIQKLVTKLFHKNSRYQNKFKDKKMYPVYVLNIKCPYADVDILLNPSKTMAEFKNWDRIEHCIQKLINLFFGNNNCKEKVKATETKIEKPKSIGGISQIQGIVRAYGYKRKANDSVTKSPEKIKKVDELFSPPKENEKVNEKSSETFDIIVSISQNQELNKFKQPLPIRIAPKEIIQNKIDIPAENKEDTLSKFSNDEGKGKNLILDMFLKSTQVYQSQENIENSQDSVETIYEEESNFLVENNVQTQYNGRSKTMSVSVNLRSTKKIKRLKKSRTEKCIQTTLENNMVSKGLQTTLKENKFTLEPEEQNHSLPTNYTLIFTNSKKSHFKFVPKNPESPKKFEFAYTQNKCNCNCHDTKLFNFHNQESIYTNVLKKKFKIKNTNSFKVHKTGKLDNYLKEMKNRYHIFMKKKDEHNKGLKPFKHDKESYENKHQSDFVTENLPRSDFVKENLPQSNFGLVDLNPYLLFNKNVQLMPQCQWNITKKEKPKTIQHLCQQSQSPYFKQQKTVDIKNPNGINDLNNFARKYDHNYPSFPHPHNQNNLDNPNYVDTFRNMNIDSFSQFQPFYKSTQYDSLISNLNDRILVPQNLFNGRKSHTFFDINPRLNNSVLGKDSTIGSKNVFSEKDITKPGTFLDMSLRSFEQFKPVFKSTQSNENILQENSIFQKNEEILQKPTFFIFGKTSTATGADTDTKMDDIFTKNKVEQIEETNTKISNASDKVQLNIMEKCLGTDKSILMKEFLDWNTQFTQDKDEHSGNQGNWTKREHFGSTYYINKVTGFATKELPEPSNVFKMGERYEFLPKGMSPILKNVKKVDQSLSQNGKNKLLEYILDTYKDDLLFVKWQHYLKDSDAKFFFENMYKEKLKMYEACVPNLKIMKNKCDTMHLNKNIFENLEIIGQLDSKFIVVREVKENMLMLFDQHAVHERIRLEKLLKIYNGAKSLCKEKLMYFIPQIDLSLLKRYESYLNYIGLTVEYFSNGIYITEVPLCLYFRFQQADSTNSLNEMIRILINETLELLKSTRGVSLKILPKLIQNVINLEACRGAIKFGDPLDNNQCTELLQQLSTTDLPFQCAHGRPTLTPLLRLTSDLRNDENVPVNLRNLKKIL